MQPFRLVPAFLLKLVLLTPLLLSLPSIGRAQLATTPTYTGPAGIYGAYFGQKTIAMGPDGYVRFVVEDYTGSGALVYVRCLDQACDAFNTQTLGSSPTGLATYSMALGPDGYARIAYETYGPLDPDLGPRDTLAFIQCNDDDCASSTTNPLVSYTSTMGMTSVAVGSDGRTYILFDDGNIYYGQAVGIATCSSGGCSATDIASISVDDGMDGAITIGADGNPAVAYTDSNNENNQLTCSLYYYGNGATTLVSSDCDWMVDISIGPDGFARLLFPNAATYVGTGALNLVSCANTSCTSLTSASIGVPAYNGGLSSVGVAPDGTPRAEIDAGSTTGPPTYSDSDYYIQCTAPDCTTYDSQTISAVSGDSQGIASLAMGSDGAAGMIAADTNGVYYQVRVTVSAVISQRTSPTETVSSDDAARSTYEAAVGTTNLGMILAFGQTQAGCAAGIETVGAISPSSYTGNVIIHRTVVNGALYANSTYAGAPKPPGSNDTSDPTFQDPDPQSGSSNGKVYDLDTAGVQPLDSNTDRLRENFYVYAALADGTRISSNYYFYIRMSCKKTSGIPGYQLVNDISDDNEIGTGSTNLSWNLQ